MNYFSDIEDIKYEIGQLDEKIEKAKKTSDQAKGAIDAYMKRWESEYGLNSKDEASEFIKEGGNELIRINKKIKSDFNDLMEKCEDGF